jgi:hypothetical protein
MPNRLTRRHLLAIEEALRFRLASEIPADQNGEPRREDYEHALSLVKVRLDRMGRV